MRDRYNDPFACRLRGLMFATDVSPQEVGKAVGVSARAIYHYMAGTRQPMSGTLFRIADYFNTSADYLAGFADIEYVNGKPTLVKSERLRK